MSLSILTFVLMILKYLNWIELSLHLIIEGVLKLCVTSFRFALAFITIKVKLLGIKGVLLIECLRFLYSRKRYRVKGSKSVFVKEFNDENYDVCHDTPGIVGMANKGGRNHTNECQFYITLAPLKSFDRSLFLLVK